MAELGDTAAAVWPSYSDLAGIVHMSVSGFGRYVRSRRGRVDIREIGREKRVAPRAAIALLVARGLPDGVAQGEVIRVVEARKSALPVLKRQSNDDTSMRRDEDLLAELRQRYDGMIARMRTPEFDRRIRELFASTTPEDMSRAVAGLGAKRSAARRHGG